MLLNRVATWAPLLRSPRCCRATRHLVQQPRSAARPRHAVTSRALMFHSSTRWLDDRRSQIEQITREYKKSMDLSDVVAPIGALEGGFPIPAGQEVVMQGYLGARTDLSKHLCFVPLKSPDYASSVQIVSSSKGTAEQKQSHETLRSLDSQTPVEIKGIVRDRKHQRGKEDSEMQQIRSKEIELIRVQPLNSFPKDIIVTPGPVFPNEQRYLQLRYDPDLRKALKFRSDVAHFCRDWFHKRHWVEVETPLLFKSTSEGAREFVVPTRRKGFAYALPQSPQQFKQLLMASGIPYYYQLARCFRDEDQRADRQPEFTQLDVEMAFSDGESVMQTLEVLITHLWKEFLGHELPFEFKRMTYASAMIHYGSDKPDLRYDMTIHNVTNVVPVDLVSKISPLTLPQVEAIHLRPKDGTVKSTIEFIRSFMESAEGESFRNNPHGAPGIFIYDSSKPMSGLAPLGFTAADYLEGLLEPEDGDVVLLQARPDEPITGGSTSLGDLRVAIHKAAVEAGIVDAPTGFEALWVIDFPLFSPASDEPGQGGAAGIASTHHPFTSPKSADDVDLLSSDPLEAVADHYDLVINGIEVGGGSRRIHKADMQHFIMKDILKMSPEKISEFSHLLEALRAGCPPHAGFALGFDRLIALMLGKQSVRDVIAFPKSGKGEDVMVKSPGPLTDEALDTYHLRLK